MTARILSGWNIDTYISLHWFRNIDRNLFSVYFPALWIPSLLFVLFRRWVSDDRCQKKNQMFLTCALQQMNCFQRHLTLRFLKDDIL